MRSQACWCENLKEIDSSNECNVLFIIWFIVQLPAVVMEITIKRIFRILLFLRTRGLGPG